MQRLTCELLSQLIVVLHLFVFWGCCCNQEVFFGIFCDFEAKEAFFVRSFTSRVKNSAKSGGQRIKRGGCPFITRIHLDTWNNKTPWPRISTVSFWPVALRGCKQFGKSIGGGALASRNISMQCIL